MKAHAEKTTQAHSQAQESGGTLQLKDNRPETQAHQEMQHVANSSEQVKQLQAVQGMADQASSQVMQLRTNQTGLPDQLKSGIEHLSGYSMNDVKVHYNSSKPAQLQAHAYAQGTQIHVAPGQEKHLGHEAWHVVQQKQGRVQATKQLKGKVNINDDVGLEHEADVMGAKALTVSNGLVSQTKSLTGFSNSRTNVQLMVNPQGVLQLKPKITYYPSDQPTVLFKNGAQVDSVLESNGAKVENISAADYDKGGSPTNDGVRTVSRHMTEISGVSFIAGHMLNKHLGGVGNHNKNITSITASANSTQSKIVEEPAKAAVRKAGSDVTYWTRVTKRGKVGKNPKNFAEGHAIEMESGFIENNTHETIVETIETFKPLVAKADDFAPAFDMESKSDPKVYESVRIAALENCLDMIATKVNKRAVIEELAQIIIGNRRNRIEGQIRNNYPTMPDRIVETAIHWYDSLGGNIGDNFEPDVALPNLIKALSTLNSNFIAEIVMAKQHKSLGEFYDEYVMGEVGTEDEVPSDGSKKQFGFVINFCQVMAKNIGL